MASSGALKRARKQAQAEARVKFAPQQRVLLEALATARGTERRTVRSARGTTSALVAAIKRARPELKRGYADAASTAEAARGDLFGHLLDVGEGARPFAAAIAREQAGVDRRAGQERANALGELTLRGTQAVQGGASAELNAHRQFGSDATTVYRQLGGVASDRGAFTASQIADIRAADKALAETRRGHTLTYKASRSRAGETARHNRATERNARDRENRQRNKDASKLGASVLGGNKPAAKETAGSHKIKGQIVDARAEYERQQRAGRSGRQIAKHARKNGVPEHILVAAADLANFGYVTPGHLRDLRQAGVSHIPKSWRRARTLPGVAAANRAGHAR